MPAGGGPWDNRFWIRCPVQSEGRAEVRRELKKIIPSQQYGFSVFTTKYSESKTFR